LNLHGVNLREATLRRREAEKIFEDYFAAKATGEMERKNFSSVGVFRTA
jgi:hypothetical protein